MTRRWLYLVGPALGAGAVFALFTAMGFVPEAVLTGENALAFALAGGGSVLAARGFGRGDYLRVAWALMALCYALLLLDVGLFGAGSSAAPRSMTSSQAAFSGVLTLLANLASVVGIVWVSRAWRVAGLTLEVPSAVFWGLIAVLSGVVLVVLGPGIVSDVRAIASGQFDAAYQLASALGDGVLFVLLVPLLVTSLSLRGGSLAWPWGLLTAGAAFWLGVDAVNLLAPEPTALVPLKESFRAAACLFQFAASLSHRRAIDEV